MNAAPDIFHSNFSRIKSNYMLRMLLWIFHIVNMFLLRLSIKSTLYSQSPPCFSAHSSV